MKLVIWDLDETLWSGTIYHNDDVKIKPETKEVLKQLDKLGIIQVVCTHNEQDKAEEELNRQGILKYFRYVYGSLTRDKPEMIAEMLHEAKVRPDEAIFIDDTPINRAMVYQQLGVHVDYFEDLFEIMKYFDTDRLILMKQQRNRETAEKKWSGDYREFLSKIQNKITIKAPEECEIPRIANLANRTNELNATRARYTEEQIKNFMNDPNKLVMVAYLSDVYGDYGLVGEIICDIKEDVFIQDICVSCRSMRRGIGRELINRAKAFATEKNVKLTGVVIPNEYNKQMTSLFEGCGFIKIKEEEGKHYYEWQKNDTSLGCML